MRLAPFRALRYDPEVAGPPLETSAPPYDDVDRLDYTHHRTANPYTVLELIAGEADRGTGAGAGAVTGAGGADPSGAFAAARATLDRWQRTGVLRRDDAEALHLYEQHELRHGVPAVQRGLVAAVDLADVDDGHLLLHEGVDDARAALRARRMRAVPVDLTPVVAVHAGAPPALAGALATARARPPVVAMTDEAGVDHRIWRLDDPGAVAAATTALAGVRAVLADGHHRIAAARRIRRELRRAGEDPGPWGRATVMLVDAADDGPDVRAIHRLLRADPPADDDGAPRLPGFRALPWRHGAAALAEALESMPELAVGVVTGQGAWVLRPDDERAVRARAAREAPLRALDAQVVEAVVLPGLAGVVDGPGGAPRAAAEAVTEVERAAADLARGAAGVLVLLRPPRAAQVLEVAAAGLRMPAKSTWFRPKPRAGLLMRRLDAD